ncbi:MAG: hypothetical protein DMG89_00300 [Acidobacteria bacterium]|nr:MAG: hypothetical protein DMG89_00300 [Acidobacteriota bacterium]
MTRQKQFDDEDDEYEPHRKRSEEQEGVDFTKYEQLEPGRVEEAVDELDRIVNVHERRMREDATDYLLASSLGVNPDLVRLRRYIPIDIYVGGKGLPYSIYIELAEALKALLSAAGFRQSDDSDVEIGSLCWRPIYASRSKINLKELEERLTLLEAVMLEASTRAEAEVFQFERDKAELEKVMAETRKLNAETLNLQMDAADKFVKLILKVAAPIAMLLGTIHVARPIQNVLASVAAGAPVQVIIRRLPAAEAHEMWTAGTSRKAIARLDYETSKRKTNRPPEYPGASSAE